MFIISGGESVWGGRINLRNCGVRSNFVLKNMEMMEMSDFMGLAIGAGTFLIIGVFHPIVIKAEYHLGTRIWWAFLLAGVLFVVASVMVNYVLVSSLLGVIGFSCFWSILELFQQQERVHKGWFPRNPKRTYPWDAQ